MNTLRTLGTLAVAGTVLALLPVGSAMAASGDTITTFTVAPGGLSLTAAPTADWTDDDAASGTTSVTGDLGEVVVDDTRGGTADWTVTVSSTVFTNTAAPGTPSTGVSYAAGSVTETGVMDATVTPGDVPVMSTSAAVVTGHDITGNNTATFDPSLTVTLPSRVLAGDYQGTVTTSVA
jgi:hypothetical protein